MLQVNTIRENTTQVLQGLAKRGLKSAQQLVDDVLQLDQSRKETQKKSWRPEGKIQCRIEEDWWYDEERPTKPKQPHCAQ